MNPRHTQSIDCLFFGFVLAGATLLAVGAAPVYADPPEHTEIAKLLPSPGIELERFGTAVAIDGDTLVIGAPNYVPDPTGPGSVYVFNRDAQGNWTESANLVVCDGACGDGFGRAVSIDGDTILVGAPAAANSEISGAAYIFTRGEQGDWTQQAKLVAADPEITKLGGSVALQGNTAVVGLISSTVPDVFIFVRDQDGDWSHESTLSAPGTNSANSLAIAIQGNTIVVGAPFFSVDDNQTIIGAVYIFTREESGNWTQQAQLLDPNPEVPYNVFGYSVAFDNNTLVIGSLTFTVSRAYVFDRNDQGEWLMQQVLEPDDDSSVVNFGASVAIQGNTLVVGASHEGPSGSAHIFTRDAVGIWSEHATLLQSDGGSNDVFGAAVAMNDGTIVVGARGDDDHGNSSGSAYLFDAGMGTSAAVLTSCSINFGTTDNQPCDVANLLDDDDIDQILRSQFGFTAFERNLTEIVIQSNGADATTMASIHTHDGSDTTNVIAKVKARNYLTNSIDDIAQYDVSFPSDDTSHTMVVNSADHVDADGDMEVRLRYVAPATFTPLGFTVGLDQVAITVQ